MELIAEWMGVSQANIKEIGDHSAVYLKNIYRGSCDGYSQSEFFERVKDKTHTIFFCKAAGSEYVFGGFNKIGYKLVSNEGKTNNDFQDDSAFIFSLTHRTKHTPQFRKDKCVRHTNKNYLIVLGQSPDLAIIENCNENEKSLSAFGIRGNTYKLHDHINPIDAHNYFAGSKNF